MSPFVSPKASSYIHSASTEHPGVPEFSTERHGRSPGKNLLVHIFRRKRTWEDRFLGKGSSTQIGTKV
jgi:hypothetical protein